LTPLAIRRTIGDRVDADTGRIMAKPARCRVGWHQYQERHTPETHFPQEAGLYLECVRCGKQKDPSFSPNFKDMHSGENKGLWLGGGEGPGGG
jgi:hypothetical protein